MKQEFILLLLPEYEHISLILERVNLKIEGLLCLIPSHVEVLQQANPLLVREDTMRSGPVKHVDLDGVVSQDIEPAKVLASVIINYPTL